MGYAFMNYAPTVTVTGLYPTWDFDFQTVVDWSVFSGAMLTSRIDVYGNRESSSDSLDCLLERGGTTQTQDGTALATVTQVGNPSPARSSASGSFSLPSGVELLKVHSSKRDGGEGSNGASYGPFSARIGNGATTALLFLDGFMTANLSCTDTLVRNWAIHPSALPPGNGKLEVTAALYHAGDASASMKIRQDGAYGTVSGTTLDSLTLSASAGAESSTFLWGRPSAATQLKLCVEGSSGVNVCGCSITIKAL